MNKLAQLYSIERWPHGWLLCSPPGQNGISLDAISKVAPLFGEQAVVQLGIPNYYKHSRTGRHVVMVVADTPASGAEWETEINAELDRHYKFFPAERWLKGTDTGSSSEAIFYVLAPELRYAFTEPPRGDVPHDAADFGRCVRLLAALPGWRERLPEVAAAYPATTWPAIIARWDEIAAATPGEQFKILQATSR